MPTKPPPAAAKNDLTARTKRVQELVAEIEAVGDAPVRALLHDLLQAVLQLHGVGLERILQILLAAAEPARPAYERLLTDNVVRGLLLIHDLHPISLRDRLEQGLAKVLPYIRSHGGDVELVQLDEGVARLRLQGTCKSCSASSITLELAVRAAIEEFCPDLAGFDVEGVEEAKVPPPAPTCVAPGPPAAVAL